MFRGMILVGLVLSLGLSGWAQARTPLVVINEFGQGKAGLGEWVELLVVGTGPGSAVDLRGWVLRDLQGAGRGGVWLKFLEHELWQAVRAGTLILIYNAADKPNLPDHFPGDNFDPEDFLLVLPNTAGDFFLLDRWEGFGNAGDCVFLVDHEGNVVFGLCYGDKTSPEACLKLGVVDRARAARYVGGDIAKICEVTLWRVGPDAKDGSTPGAPNSPENAVWIESLRHLPE